MNRPPQLGMRRSLAPSARPNETQSQESTQQPSIEIRPSTLTQPFRSPAPVRAHTEPPVSPEPVTALSSLAASSSDSAIGGTSFEETSESAIAWTQSQVQQNQQHDELQHAREQRQEVGGLEMIREISEGEALTSPEVAPQARAKWATESPQLPRPSTPLTEGDELDDSIVDPNIDGGFEETEVDGMPTVATPEQSQSPPSAPSRPAKSSFPIPPAMPPNTSPRTNMSPITKHSPHFTNGSTKSISRMTTASPSKAFGRKGTLTHGRKGKEGNQSDESFVGQVKVTPLDALNNFTMKYSEPQIVQQPNAYAGLLARATSSLESEQNREEGIFIPEEGTEKDSEPEEANDELKWDQPLSPIEFRNNDLVVATSSPSPPRRNGELSSSLASPQRTPDPKTSRRFNRIPYSTPTDSQRVDGKSSALFSSPDFLDDVQERELSMTQRSNGFQATQVVAGQYSSSSEVPTHEQSQPNQELEATQPDTQEDVDESRDNPIANVNHRSVLPIPSVSVLSKAPSVASTTTSSRVEVPAHRQLQRRKVEDDPAATPIRHFPQLPSIPGSSDPAKLQHHRSELVRAPTNSSPFKKSSPVRRSSEPPILQESLQETVDPPAVTPPNDNSTSGQASAPVLPSPVHTTSPPLSPSLHMTTTPPRPSSPAPERPVEPTPMAVEHEPTFTDRPSLPSIPPVKPSPKKQYGGPASKRRRVIPPISPEPVAEKQAGSESDTTVEDEEDHTYHPVASSSKPKPPRIHGPAGPSTSTAGKRKRRSPSPSSILSPPPDSENQSSSSAPEDSEDNTYQPTLLQFKLPKSKGKARASDTSSRGSSRQPKNKKLKTKRQTPQAASPHPSASDDSPHRILAVYHSHYYPATILGRTAKGYNIEFDDGDTKMNVRASHMRRLVLRKGDPLEAAHSKSGLPKHFEVAEDWDGKQSGVKCQAGGKNIGRVEMALIAVRTAVVNAQFGDRFLEDIEVTGVLGPAGSRFAGPSTRTSLPRSPIKPKLSMTGTVNGIASPSRSRGRSVSPTKRASNIFKGMLFLVTKGEGADNSSDAMTELIQSHGGTVKKGWRDVFDPDSPGQCVFTNGLKGTPFLIPTGSKVLTTPKLMAALAKGIPCVSAKFIDDSIANLEKVDWRGYLISPGYSDHTGQHMSQVVDLNWGEEGWIARKATPLRRPLRGKNLLFVQPTAKSYDTLKSLVPLCIYLLGAEEFQAVQNLAFNKNIIHDSKWDYVLFETREAKSLPGVLQGVDNLCDVHWLKQCLIMGAALPPSLEVEEKKVGKRK